jgi:hypothetical protein
MKCRFNIKCEIKNSYTRGLLFSSIFLFLSVFIPAQNKILISEKTISLNDTSIAAKYMNKGDSLFKEAKYDSSSIYFER